VKKREFEIGQQYHLYARGTDKRNTFLEDKDYYRFMVLVYACNTKDPIKIDRISFKNINYFTNKNPNPIVQLDQFCLMQNHFHILCTEIVEGGISKFMQKVLTGYTLFFNKKYQREGALFSATYKTKHINTDLYTDYVKKYIYFNPLKIINSEYKSEDLLLYETKNITEEEQKFLREYPYKYF
jgi:putative transposase